MTFKKTGKSVLLFQELKETKKNFIHVIENFKRHKKKSEKVRH